MSLLICVIDDDQINNYITSKMLLKYNPDSHVKCFSDATSALDYINNLHVTGQHFPDYLFLDIAMPILDGWQFLDGLDQLNLDPFRSMKIYMLSTSLKVDEKVRALTHLRVSGFYDKPLKAENIIKLFR